MWPFAINEGMATLQEQIARLDELIARRESGMGIEEVQDAGDRLRITSLEVLYRRRDQLQARLVRQQRGGALQTFDPLRFG